MAATDVYKNGVYWIKEKTLMYTFWQYWNWRETCGQIRMYMYITDEVVILYNTESLGTPRCRYALNGYHVLHNE